MSARIEDLLPAVQVMCNALLQQARDASVPLIVVHTLRTWDEQDRLYAKGRSLPGEPCWHREGRRALGTCKQHPFGAPVTRARAGFSWHNFGRAFDVALASTVGTAMWPPADDPRWAQVGVMGESVGLEWGGRWKVPDSGHFQARGGLTLLAARSGFAPKEATA